MESHLKGYLLLAALLGVGLAVPTPARGAPAKDKASSRFATAGSVEFGLSGFMDLDGSDSTDVYANVALGYFLIDGLELGMTALEGTAPSGERDTFGLFSEYDMVGALPLLVPFYGGALRHTAPPADVANGPDGRILALYGGVNLPLNAHAAVSLTGEMAVADHAVLGSMGQHKRIDRSLKLGLRFFF